MDLEMVVKYLLWPAATAIGGYAVGRARDLLRMRTFRRIFGKGVRKSEDVVVSVPLWRAIGSERSTPRFVTMDDGGPSQIHHGPDNMYNREDMFTAASVLNVIGNHLEKEIKYSDDTETPEWNKKTAILIGSPNVNFHARSYFRRHASERPNELFPNFRRIEKSDDASGGLCIYDPKTEKEFRCDKDTDYGLVLRVENVLSNNANHFVFLLAGINASSTREAGRLFNDQWSKLGKERPALRRLLLWISFQLWRKAPPPLGFVFRMTRDMAGTGKIEYYV